MGAQVAESAVMALCRGGCGTLIYLAVRRQGWCAKCFPGKVKRAQKKRLATLRAQGKIKTGRELLEDAPKPVTRWFETWDEALAWKTEMLAAGHRVSLHYAGDGVDGTAYPGKKVKVKRSSADGADGRR